MTTTLLLALMFAHPLHRAPTPSREATYRTALAPALEMNSIGAAAVSCGMRTEGWYLAVQTSLIRTAERSAEGEWGGTGDRLTPAASRHFDEALATMAATEQAKRNVPSIVCNLLSRSGSLSPLDRTATGTGCGSGVRN